MQRQIARVHVGSFTTEHRAALVKLLAELAPGDLNRTQFYSSGAEAVEAALRLAEAATRPPPMPDFAGPNAPPAGIGKGHRWTPLTSLSRMPASSLKKKKK